LQHGGYGGDAQYGDPALRAEVVSVIEISQRSSWRLARLDCRFHRPMTAGTEIIGRMPSRRSYTLERIAQEYEPTVIGSIVSRMVPGRKG